MELKSYFNMINLLFKVLEFFGINYISNKEKAYRYINQILIYIKVIVETENVLNDETKYAQQMVRTFYLEAPKQLGDIVSANTLAKVMQALSAARVYYWVKFSKDKEKSVIIELLNERIKRIEHGIVRLNSSEVALQKIKHLKDNEVLDEYEISLICSNLFADIAELEEHHISISINKG